MLLQAHLTYLNSNAKGIQQIYKYENLEYSNTKCAAHVDSLQGTKAVHK